MAEIICPLCKASNRGTAQFCSECGTPLLQGVPKSEPTPKLKAQPAEEQQGEGEVTQPKRMLQNRYQIGEALGQGGFGSVYRAWDVNLNRNCAIKENLATTAEAQRQFMREATVLANLSHSNLPRVIDHFIIPEQGQYLVMDFVEGEDLEHILDKREIIPVGEALEWILQVADALDYLHRQEPPVFHRDIKPANIRITPKGRAMLVDFGLVKVFDPHMNTTVGARAITPGYAPPEQYGRGGTDARTDIYALGATLYAMLTGHEPIESVRRMAGEYLPPAQKVNPGVPLLISDAIERAMALDPVGRFQSAAEFLAALQAGKKAFEQGGAGERLVTVVVDPDMESEAIMAAAYQQSQGMSAPLLPTAKMQADFPATTAIDVPVPSQGPSDVKPAGSRRNLLLIGIGGAVVLLLCIALAGGGMFALFSGNGDGAVEKTLTARARMAGPVEKTLTARAAQVGVATEGPTKGTPTLVDEATRPPTQNVTATELQATKALQTSEAATTVAQETSSSVSQATSQAVMNEVAQYDEQATLKYGPKSGNLVHRAEDGFIETQSAAVGVRNLITEVKFKVPYDESVGDWDFGLVFRFGESNNEFRLILLSDKTYAITSTTGDPDGETLASGEIDNLSTSVGDENKIRLYAIEDQGWLFVNDEFITEFDASQHYSGGVMIGVGFINGMEVTGQLTEYKDFTVWSVQN